MKIEKIKITKIEPAKYNPRKINDNDYTKLEKSINEFGLVDPIIINLKNNRIIGGHQRYKVLLDTDKNQELNLLRFGDIGWIFNETEFTVQSEGHEKALNLSLNKISGEWDEPKLNELIEDLKLQNFNIDLTGFDDVELEDLFPESPVDVEEDDFESEIDEDEVDINPGDIFLLGNHRLMCGDSTNKENVLRLLNNNPLNMVFTDPPYNVDYGASKNHPSWKIRSIKNDALDDDEWIKFNKGIIESLKLCQGDIYVWGASGPAGMQQRLLMTQSDIHWSSTIIWNKHSLVLSPSKYQRKYEPCFYGWNEGINSSFCGDRKQTEVWDFNKPHSSDLHPTMKPVELCAYAIQNSSKINDNVLDLFGGSGSTLMACEQTKRNCYMMELDPIYCQTIINRWEQYTGQRATQNN